MRTLKLASVLLAVAMLSPCPPALARQATPRSSDEERCAAVAAFAKAKFAKPDGVVSDWAMDFEDQRLASCDWKSLGVAFPKRYDPNWKPSRCQVEGAGVTPDSKAVPACLEPEFQAFIRIERAAVDVERIPRRCDTNSVGWCSDAKYSARIQVVWAALSLYGGTELCELDQADDQWTFKGCRANGPVF